MFRTYRYGLEHTYFDADPNLLGLIENLIHYVISNFYSFCLFPFDGL